MKVGSRYSLAAVALAVAAKQSGVHARNSNDWFVEGSLCKQDCCVTGEDCNEDDVIDGVDAALVIKGVTCVTGTTGTDCGQCDVAASWQTTYGSVEACCSNGLSWVNEEYCVSRSAEPTEDLKTGLWFVNWQDNCKSSFALALLFPLVGWCSLS